MPHVAFVTNVLAHYRVPCFGSLAKKLREQIDFFFLTENMSHRGYVISQGGDGLPATWLKGWNWHRPPNDDRHLNDIRPITKGNYDLIILGAWDEPSYFMLWLWAVASRKKVLFWIESTAYDAYNGPHRRVKEYYKRVLLKKAAGCSVPGKRAFEYCSVLGMPESQIFLAPNATDRPYFSSQADRLLPLRGEIRKKLGIEGVTLYSWAVWLRNTKMCLDLSMRLESLQ